MPLNPEQQFDKALLLLDRGEVDRGESILKEVISASQASGDEVLLVRARCCLGELLLELGRKNEAMPLLRSVANHVPSADLDDVLDFEQQRARKLLGAAP